MTEQKISNPPTLFGFKVVSISASMGWGGQGGSCSLSLVDEGQGRSSIPKTGTAVGFKYEQFFFGGILQRWTYKESQSGRFYDIVLESPAKLLDGVQVILDQFDSGYREDGSLNTLTGSMARNVWNPFAEFENFNYGGLYGASNVNSAGMPVGNLLAKLNLFGTGAGNFGGKLKFGESEYLVDFSEIESAVASRAQFYRVKGPVQSLNGILQDLAEVCQVDYFVDLVDAAGAGNGPMGDPTIKVRVADKAFVASGVVESYVDSVKNTGVVVSASLGEELQDASSTKVIIGGPASRYYDAPVATSLPIWDILGNNAAYVLGSGISSTQYANPNSQVPIRVGGASYTATVFELRMALGGMESWETFKIFQTMAGLEPNGFSLQTLPCVGNAQANTTILNLLTNGRADALDLALTDPTKLNKSYLAALKSYGQEIYNAVNKTATTYYGQMFMLPLPYEPGGIDNNLKFISEDVQYQASWENAASAWTSFKPIVDWNFYDGDGKLLGVSTFPISTNIDYSPLGSDYATTAGGAIATTKGGPEKDIFWIGSVPYCAAKSGAQLRQYDSITTPDFGITVLAAMFFGITIPPNAYISPGKQSVQVMIPPAVVLPTSIGVPQESKRYTWGPWYGTSSDNGRAEVEVDGSLRPETFGSVALMDSAGFASVFAGLAKMESVESGAVELAEVPQFNMGDRFASAGPYVTSMDISIGIDGCKTNYKFNTWTPNFGKMAKYNIDRISRINKASIAFMKTERGKVNNRPGKKFEFKKTDFNSLNGGNRFNNRFGMEVFGGMFRNV